MFSKRSSRPKNLNAALTVIVLALIIVMRTLPVGVTAVENTSTASGGSCASSVIVTNTIGTITQATQNAIGSTAYSLGTVGYQNITYSSIFETGQFTAGFPQCTHVVKSYNVVFFLHNSTGSDAGVLVVGETPSLTVTGFLIQPPVFANTDNEGWSGQQAYDSGTTIEAAAADWTQSTPSAPSDSGDVGCGTPETCNFALWVGLIDNSLGQTHNHLDQAGTLANCNTTSSSSTTCASHAYSAFYEVLDQGAAIICDSSANGGDVTVNAGDSISASVENGVYVGGNSNDYYFYVADTSGGSGDYCSAIAEDPDMDAPTYAEAMGENYGQEANGVGVKLADFNNPSFAGATVYLSGASHGYFNSYTTTTVNMYNQEYIGVGCSGGDTDVTGGSLNSYGDFSLTWDTSLNTPPSHGC